MTDADQEIIDAIWGPEPTKDALHQAQELVDGINLMALIAQQRVSAGMTLYIPPTDLH